MRADYKTTGLQGITDLTVLARIKTGFVPGAFNTITYVDRLTRVLRLLNSVRQASREASLQPSPFADSIGRFRGIHFFRFAVVPSGDVPGRHQLLLNVTFDGGWEPYMRLIWGPLGTLLDLIFCHCERYPLAFYTSFDDYVRWVRDQEVPSSFFYADSAATVADLHYLGQLEEQQRNDGGRPDADAKATGLAVPAQPTKAIPGVYAVGIALRALKALYSLAELFPQALDEQTRPPFRQDGVLLRFAQDLLRELREWIAQGLFDPGQPFDRLRATFEPERQWLMLPIGRTQEVPERLEFRRSNVQAGIDLPYPADVTQGVLVLLRIGDAPKFKQWLSGEPVTRGDANTPEDRIYRSLSLTYDGLRRLGVPRDALDDWFPREFIEGMEKRAGVLGDLRGNHPEQWRRPRRNWPWPEQNRPPFDPPIELSTVHVLVQLRTALEPGEDDTDGTAPLPRLAVAVAKLNDETGLQILFVQPMKLGARPDGASAGRDHFGFVDGISQPTLSPPAVPPSYWNDQVKPGELFLGYSNSRGDKAPQNGERPGLLLDDGSFLVVRKLRQFPERLDSLLADTAKRLKPNATPDAHNTLRELIKAKMMGRRTDGKPLVKFRGSGSNDFDFRGDSHGAQCPFQSHIRRANPREPLPLQLPPRIARRGMSYDDPRTEGATDRPRGLIFMAYNASIAEQFEVIQRWLTGGNSSGLSSAQSDPLLGVPEPGQRRAYRFEHDGEVMRVDLGEQPLVQLEWGLYAFVPSIAALKGINAIVERGSPVPVVIAPRLPSPLPSGLEAWRLLLEDDNVRDNVRARTWEAVRKDKKYAGVLNADGYGLLVGSKEKVLEVLQDRGGKFSVCGYGERMEKSIGHGFLGMDDVKPDDGHQDQAPAVNKIIENFVSEVQAFDATREHASNYLKTLLDRRQALTGKREAPVDLIEFGRSVLASLCSDWFGLPDGVLMKYAPKADDRLQDDVSRCPGNLLTVSRYIFSPHPRVPVEIPAKKHGDLVLKAVKALLKEAREGQRKLKPLVNDIVSTPPLRGNADLQARTVAGVMLGFPPTVLGNLVPVLVAWTGSMKLWEFQQELLQSERNSASAMVRLREAFLKTMSAAPAPYAIWRTAKADESLGDAGSKAGDAVVVGLGSAVADGGDSMLMFGGARSGEHPTTHACPGYAMAMGVMLGCVTALLTAGELRPTLDPRVLTLRAA